MEYRYHPVLEGLKVNEDGSDVIYLGKKIESKTYSRQGNSIPQEVVTIKYKVVSLIRLVNECWNGLAENRGFITKKIDYDKGNHYSNLTWSKQGVGISHNSISKFNVHPKFTEQEYNDLKLEIKENEAITEFLKRKKISTKAYYTAKNKYDKKENR